MKKTLLLTLVLMLFMCNKVNAADYIYLDLYYGNVTIKDGKYSGYTFNGTAKSGTHSASNNYYIFQSKGEKNLTAVPNYARVKYNSTTSWAEYITNHPGKSTNVDLADSVDDVIAAWGAVTSLNTTNIASTGAAISAGRKPTPNYIFIKGGGTYNVVIDDIWSSYQANISTALQNQGREDLGGIVYIPTELNTTLNLSIEGDNRFGNIHAATHDGRNGVYDFDPEHTNKIVIKELNKGSDATLTLANLMVDSNTNHTSACLGGTDNWDHSTKMIFESGVIYAGSAKDDFGTAIGGGGNGDGIIIIKGGKITAICSSTGTALGGGCGTAGPGGYGNITIEGGEVYAYSCQVSFGSNTSYNGALPTAIGGGSSGIQIGGTGIVNIKGGKVYAYSEKGTAIGAGGGGIGLSGSNYYSATGGVANVTISGGEIIALSGQGCAIGGGPGGGSLYSQYANVSATNLPMDILSANDAGTLTAKVNANGGEATLTITGGTIKTGSIGGGSPLFELGTDKNKYRFYNWCSKSLHFRWNNTWSNCYGRNRFCF